MTTTRTPTIGLSESDRVRFEVKVLPADENGCRRWGNSLDKNGYGQFRVSGRVVKAHQVAWLLERGPLPEGLEPDHTCEVRDCVTPDHLEWVTHAENNHRIRERSTHCRSGRHRWDEQVPW